ncbi:hypothetical protein GCM10027405_20140 [Arthrobacter alkaliphilus]|uniref:hypothetical protein n=1 Tax=Arthrobacter alkaliphilus TaxID=369936 RepID=UPI001F319B30|nr:hypothetical protein [Arthrobacter alkaliphilus]
MEAEQRKSPILRVLRSVMLAGAGAVVWIALSSTAANADSGNNNPGLLGGTGPAVSNVAHSASKGISGTVNNAIATVVAVPAPAAVSIPAPAVASVPVPAVASVPVPQLPEVQLPAAQVPSAVANEIPQLTAGADQVLASTPIVNAVVPDGTVGAVTSTVVPPVTRAVDGVGSGVGSLVGSLPVAVPDVTLPSLHVPDAAGTGELLGAEPAVAESADGVASVPATDVVAPLPGLAGLSDLTLPNGTPSKAPVWTSGSNDPSGPLSGGTFPPGAPGGSHAISGSAVLSSNAAGSAAAWLEGTNLIYPLAGTLLSPAAAGRVPAPVSFDPGSSPD